MPLEVGEDPVFRPVTETRVDENGATVIIGYPSSGSEGSYTGDVGTDPGVGVGIGADGREGEPEGEGA